MKNCHIFLIALAAALTLPISCQKQSGSGSITVNPAEVSLPPKAGSSRIIITSDMDWTLSRDGSWIKSISPTFGAKGETLVSFTYDENTSKEARTARINVTSSSAVAGVELTQCGASDYPARWLQTTSEMDIEWTQDTVCYASHGPGADKAYITLSGSSCQPVMASSKYIAVKNLLPEGSVEFVLPASHVEAGTGVDLMFTLTSYSSTNSVFKYYICEILDGGEWKANEADLKTAGENASIRYSFYVKYESDYQYTTFVQGFKLENPADGEIKARIRPVGNILANGSTYSEGSTLGNIGFVEDDSHALSWVPCIMTAYENIPVKDSHKLAILGNSFSYYGGTAFMLKELARSQGHDLHIRAHVKGSQYFSDHLQLEKSLAVINEGGYDFALLQDQSTQHSNYYDNGTVSVKTNTVKLINSIKSKSPYAKCILENTWAYPKESWQGYGSMNSFTASLYGGTSKLCDDSDVDATLSPIGLAFKKAYNSGFKDLYYSDSKHPNRNGSYLKSCVNYLVLFGEKFDTNASDCGIDSATAARLRTIAEEVVFEK